jgi:hypothetical protein
MMDERQLWGQSLPAGPRAAASNCNKSANPIPRSVTVLAVLGWRVGLNRHRIAA